MSDLKNSINTLVRDLELNLHQAIKIFNTFFLEFSGTKKLLEYSLEKKDFESISRQCHKLQGTSANLRIAPKVCDRCGEVYWELINVRDKVRRFFG